VTPPAASLFTNFKGHEQQHKSPVSTVPTSAKNSGTVSTAPASTKDSIC